MAKVSGPLMSLDARGKFAGALVFSGWKGRPTVRQLVTPANPQSADQTTQRNYVRVGGAGQHWANITDLKGDGRDTTDKVSIQDETPAGQAWNGTLVKAMIGADSINFDAAAAAWTALAPLEKTDWNDAAATYEFPTVAQAAAGGGYTTQMPAGQAFFHYQYGLYILGITTLPGALVPTYI